MKEVHVFSVCSSEPEESEVIYFIGNGSKDKFNRDVREIIVKILDEKYSWVKIDEKTYVRKRALNNSNLKNFINCFRKLFNYNGELYIDNKREGGLLHFSVGDENFNYDPFDIEIKIKQECGVRVFFNIFIDSVRPSEIIKSDEFTNMMEKRGWEKLDVVSDFSVCFDEIGGFVQNDKGEWFNFDYDKPEKIKWWE